MAIPACSLPKPGTVVCWPISTPFSFGYVCWEWTGSAIVSTNKFGTDVLANLALAIAAFKAGDYAGLNTAILAAATSFIEQQPADADLPLNVVNQAAWDYINRTACWTIGSIQAIGLGLAIATPNKQREIENLIRTTPRRRQPCACDRNVLRF